VAQIVRPETILGWHRKLVAKKFDGSRKRASAAGSRTAPVIEELVLRFARDYDVLSLLRFSRGVAQARFCILPERQIVAPR
jgi:hypothetical protein